MAIIQDELVFGNEEHYHDGKESFQYVYFNSKLIGALYRKFPFLNAKGGIDYDTYTDYNFVSIRLNDNEVKRINDYPKFPVRGEETYFYVSVDLQNANENFDLGLMIETIYNATLTCDVLKSIENDFINDFNVLIEKYGNDINFNLDVNNGVIRYNLK